MADKMMRIAGRNPSGVAKSVQTDASGVLYTSDAMYDYKELPYYIFAASKMLSGYVFAQNLAVGSGQPGYGDIYFGDVSSTITTKDPTWYKTGNVPVIVRKGIVTTAGIIVAFCVDKTIRRSADNGLTWTTVDTCAGMLAGGMDCNGETIIYAEYVTSGTLALNVRRSTDGGLTWNTVLTQNTPADIRHFHTVVYFREFARWYCTSGDDIPQTKWWKSDDNGANWTLLVSNDLKLRTCGIVTSVQNGIVWSADEGRNSYIFAGDKNQPLKTATPIGILGGHSLGICGGRNTMMTSYRVESLDPDGFKYSEVMVSGDAGRTWRTEYRILGDHFFFVGPIYTGHIFIQADNNRSWLATPKHRSKQEALNYTYTKRPYRMVVHSNVALRDTNTVYSESLPFPVYDAEFEVSNYLTDGNTNMGVTVGVVTATNGTYKKASDNSSIEYIAVNGNTIGTLSAAMPILPAGTKIALKANLAPNALTVSVTLHGTILRPVDHRIAASESYT